MKLTSRALELLEQVPDAEENEDAEMGGGMPLLGKVAAGVPIEAIENTSSLSLQSLFCGGEDTFVLEVSGDSMINDGIFDGDYIICRKSQVAENGQLVVAIVDNDNATVKRFYKENGGIRLQPANEKYEPLYPENCRIEAIVVGLIRKI